MAIPLHEFDDAQTKELICKIKAFLYETSIGVANADLARHLWKMCDELDQYWPGDLHGDKRDPPVVGERE
jgi:hypothetical protein